MQLVCKCAVRSHLTAGRGGIIVALGLFGSIILHELRHSPVADGNALRS